MGLGSHRKEEIRIAFVREIKPSIVLFFLSYIIFLSPWKDIPLGFFILWGVFFILFYLVNSKKYRIFTSTNKLKRRLDYECKKWSQDKQKPYDII
jgi:hypothetical protein